MIKKAYESSKPYVLMFAVFSMIFYTVGTSTIERGLDNLSKIPVILEKVERIEVKQDDCVDKATVCSHDITVLQGYHNEH